MSHEKNPALLSIESWLVNRDPYNGLLQSLYNWVGFHSLYNPTNQMVTQILFISTHPVDSGKFTASHFGTSERSAYNGKAVGQWGKREEILAA